MKIYTVNVTASDIEHGIEKDCHSCPIALAANRDLAGTKEQVWLPNFCHVRVGPVEMVIYRQEPHRPKLFMLPLCATTFIELFDSPAKGRCVPFSFEVEI